MIDILTQHRAERKIALVLLAGVLLALMVVRGVLPKPGAEPSKPVPVETR